uniref:EAL domain-containing protein n=1 Tax=Kineococcus sp. SYSU DK005 TaxID=3383126 RepID=UPI003D7EB8CE
LAHSLGMRLLVEGVEDATTLRRLGELGVDETQGYHHARPMPADQVLPWLRRHRDQNQDQDRNQARHREPARGAVAGRYVQDARPLA